MGLGFRKKDAIFEENWTALSAVSRLTFIDLPRELFEECHGALALGLEVFESAPELVPRAMDVGLHGTERQIECARDLLV